MIVGFLLIGRTSVTPGMGSLPHDAVTIVGAWIDTEKLEFFGPLTPMLDHRMERAAQQRLKEVVGTYTLGLHPRGGHPPVHMLEPGAPIRDFRIDFAWSFL